MVIFLSPVPLSIRSRACIGNGLILCGWRVRSQNTQLVCGWSWMGASKQKSFCWMGVYFVTVNVLSVATILNPLCIFLFSVPLALPSGTQFVVSSDSACEMHHRSLRQNYCLVMLPGLYLVDLEGERLQHFKRWIKTLGGCFQGYSLSNQEQDYLS